MLNVAKQQLKAQMIKTWKQQLQAKMSYSILKLKVAKPQLKDKIRITVVISFSQAAKQQLKAKSSTIVAKREKNQKPKIKVAVREL